MRWSAVSRSCGTLFDLATKTTRRDQLAAQMERPAFWDNPEKAQQTIQQLKPLNDLLKPAEELRTSAEDLTVLAELAEEDATLEADLETELKSFKKRLGDFELRASLSGPLD